MSTGLIYLPGPLRDNPELTELAKVVARHGGFYASHIRNEGDGLLDSIDEALTIGREAGLPVHISHLKATGKANWGLTVAGLRADRRGPEGGAGRHGRPVSVHRVEHVAGGDGRPALGPPGERRGLRPDRGRPGPGPRRSATRSRSRWTGATEGPRSGSPAMPRSRAGSAATSWPSPGRRGRRRWRSSWTSSGTAGPRRSASA